MKRTVVSLSLIALLASACTIESQHAPDPGASTGAGITGAATAQGAERSTTLGKQASGAREHAERLAQAYLDAAREHLQRAQLAATARERLAALAAAIGGRAL